LGEKIQVLSVISRSCEDRLPVIPPLCDVVRVSDDYGTGYSWHGENYKPVKARMSIINRFLSLLFHCHGMGNRLAELTIFQEFFDGQTDIFGNLSEEDWGDVSPRMEWNRGAPTIGVAKLLVTSFLANLRKTEAFQNVYHFSRL